MRKESKESRELHDGHATAAPIHPVHCMRSSAHAARLLPRLTGTAARRSDEVFVAGWFAEEQGESERQLSHCVDRKW